MTLTRHLLKLRDLAITTAQFSARFDVLAPSDEVGTAHNISIELDHNVSAASNVKALFHALRNKCEESYSDDEFFADVERFTAFDQPMCAPHVQNWSYVSGPSPR